MTTTAESIVRPFQTPTPGTPLVEAYQVGVPIVLLNIGRSGSGKEMKGSFTQTITFYMDKNVNETKNS